MAKKPQRRGRPAPRPAATPKAVARPGTAARPSATSAAARAKARPPLQSGEGQPPPEPGFKVEAIAMGYYDHTRRRPGDVFIISAARHFSSRWMRRVDPETPEKVTTPNEAIAREHDAIVAMRHATAQPAGMQVGRDDVPPNIPTGDHNPLGEDFS